MATTNWPSKADLNNLCLTNGYCYIQLLEVACENYSSQLQVQLITCALAQLQAFPPINRVIAFVYHYSKESHTLFPMPYKMGDIYHISPQAPRTTDLFNLMSVFLGDATPIGSDTTLKVFSGISQFGFDVSTTYKKLAEEQLSDRRTQLRNYVDDVFFERLKSGSHNPKKSIRIVIRQTIYDMHKVMLVEKYPEFKLEFANAINQNHALLAAMRKIECSKLLELCGYRYNGKSPGNYDVSICDVGGNMITHFNAGRLNVHCCSPVLGPRDSSRLTDQLSVLSNRKSMTTNQLIFTRNLVDRETRKYLVCKCTAQECNITAPYCIFLHSTYDMTLTEIANILRKKNSTIGYAAFIYTADMIIHPEGTIEKTEVYWKVSQRGRNKYIRFNVKDDASWGYEHDYETFLALANANYCKADDGTV